MTQPHLLWPQRHPPSRAGQEVPSLLQGRFPWHSAPCRLLLLSLFAVQSQIPFSQPALSVRTQILPLLPEVISILMEIPLYGLSPVVLIQCPCSNAFPSPAQNGNSAFQCTLGCFCPNRTPPHTVKLRHFWPGVKSPLHSLLVCCFLVFFFSFLYLSP